MSRDKGLEKIGDLFIGRGDKAPAGQSAARTVYPRPKMPAFPWQELALKVIKELNVPGFKRSAVFKVCKQKPRSFIEKCLNDTKELCPTGEKWKYFFKIVGGK